MSIAHWACDRVGLGVVVLNELARLGLYLRCWTEEEIAKDVGLDRVTVHGIVETFTNEKTDNPPTSLQEFNVWDFGNCDPWFGQKHPGHEP
jgi:hypothetical protein